MKTYLVGGAVRDELLGLPISEKDWVVVGGSADALLEAGYKQVGNSFPVFLHPETGDEYALARTERKTGKGYDGFAFDFNPEVTLEQDLQRRDLTVNAIAKSDSGQLIDPYGGIADLRQRLLRHVSEAFSEDPLRILRVARFRARLDHLGFEIAPSTFALMRELSASDELEALSAERIWVELEKGLGSAAPDVFIDTLQRCGALKKILPELDTRFHYRDNLRDTAAQVGERCLAALRYLARLPDPGGAATGGDSGKTRLLAAWGICCHGLDDNTTPKNLVPRTFTRVELKKHSVDALCQNLSTPSEFRRVATLAAAYMHYVIQADACKAQTIVELLDACDAWRKPEQFHTLLLIAECLTSTSSDRSQQKIGSIALLRQAYTNCAAVKPADFVAAGIEGEAVGEAMHNARKVAVAELKKQFS